MSRGRTMIVVVLIASLALTGVMQAWVREARSQLIGRSASVSNVSGLDSFALGLILGGLRGPLVMLLWTSSENQKANRELENIDTKIELIRMLQPDFDSVHIFQMWNKAYNLSVQMTSLQNKYSMIVDALDYGRRVDEERPDSINILVSIADIYFNKLGTSSEKRVFGEWVRDQTRAPKGEHNRQASTMRKQRLDPMLTADGRILPQLLAPRHGWSGEYDGAELQFLERYSKADGFPYGISPLALAYNYYKRANVLMHTTAQRHLQLSDNVIDSRPAIALKIWCEELNERGLTLEAAMFGRPTPEERLGLEQVTEAVAIGTPLVDKSSRTGEKAAEAIFSYQRCPEVADHAITEYRRHIASQRFGGGAGVYASHIDGLMALADMARAERAYLLLLAHAQGMAALPAGETTESLKQAAQKYYTAAISRHQLMILKYFTPEEVKREVYPRITQQKLGTAYQWRDLDKVDPSLYSLLRSEASREVERLNLRQENISDVQEYETYLSRAAKRLSLLK